MATFTENRKARFEYEILETFEGGMVLTGFETKAIRAGRMDLAGSYVVIRNKEAFLLNAAIRPLQPQNTPRDYDPARTRKLLLKQKELTYLIGKTNEKGLTLIPLRVYTKGRYIKLECALARGKKKYEKRELLKKRVAKREIERTLKQY